MRLRQKNACRQRRRIQERRHSLRTDCLNAQATMGDNDEYLRNTYDYMDEQSIDDELKCSICRLPFQSPVSLSCQHTFCRQCIERWLQENDSCPTCRENPELDEFDEVIYSPINTFIVTNQLDRLLVRCNQCQQANILRGNFRDHEDKCPNRVVGCSSSDIECPWKGRKEDKFQHINQCPFNEIRPIIVRLRSELEKCAESQEEMREQLDQQASQISYLLACVNKGNPMNSLCLRCPSQCHFVMRQQQRAKLKYQCTICQEMIQRRQVSLHACSLKDIIDCICQSCFDEQYQSEQEFEENETDDDVHQPDIPQI